MAKINKGDLVEIVSPGHCWSEYTEKFIELGMENPHKARKSLPRGTKGIVLNFIPRSLIDEELMVSILFNGSTYLYGLNGITVLKSYYEIY